AESDADKDAEKAAEEANAVEEKWIKHFDSTNPERGFNLAKGGEHVPHPIRKNPWDDPDYRARVTATIKNDANTSEGKAKRSLLSRAAWSNPEVRTKIMSASKAGLNTLESKAKRSMIMKASAAVPESMIKRSEASKEVWSRPEVRKKMADIAKNRVLSPDFLRHTPESHAKVGLKNRRYITKDGQITHKICKKHGLVPITDCYVGTFKSGRNAGRLRIQCKICMNR
ncbi:hypothetical protein LCGC14_2079670, partial [marine sediment metagenome]